MDTVLVLAVKELEKVARQQLAVQRETNRLLFALATQQHPDAVEAAPEPKDPMERILEQNRQAKAARKEERERDRQAVQQEKLQAKQAKRGGMFGSR